MKPVEERLKDFVLPEDSLETMELLMDLEDEYDIIITAKEIETLRSKEDVITLLKSKINK